MKYLGLFTPLIGSYFLKLHALSIRRRSLRRLGSLFLSAVVLTLVATTQAQDLGQVDRLTQQWLDTDRQASSLQADWQAQQPILEQRLTLLKAEKAQLQAILKQSNDSQSSVETRRAELLTQQAELEQQQQDLTQGLSLLTKRIGAVSKRLPPPLKEAWREEQNATAEQAESSLQLQVSLAQLSRLADFDQRISVHEMPITKPDGSNVLVKQLYLGIGMAWFVSADGQLSGWGQADDDDWTWEIKGELDASEISKAIAIFEKRQQADFVRLPVKLASTFESIVGNSDVQP